jgi:hypothetical protein
LAKKILKASSRESRRIWYRKVFSSSASEIRTNEESIG